MQFIFVFFLVILFGGCTNTTNFKNMSALEIQTSINSPLYMKGTVERAWEDTYWNEQLSYKTRNRISDVMDKYQAGSITEKEAFHRMKLIRK